MDRKLRVKLEKKLGGFIAKGIPNVIFKEYIVRCDLDGFYVDSPMKVSAFINNSGNCYVDSCENCFSSYYLLYVDKSIIIKGNAISFPSKFGTIILAPENETIFVLQESIVGIHWIRFENGRVKTVSGPYDTEYEDEYEYEDEVEYA